jgi:hypothetical protein
MSKNKNNKIPKGLLSPVSGEFVSRTLEQSFLKDSWPEFKKIPRNVLLLGGIVFFAFITLDYMTIAEHNNFYWLLALRSLTAGVLIYSSLIIMRADDYFDRYQELILLNQMVMIFALLMLFFLRKLTFIHNAAHVFIATLIIYQFVNNKFPYTIAACAFLGLSFLAVSYSKYNLGTEGLLRYFLYLTLANGLGLSILHFLNRCRRLEYLSLQDVQKTNKKLACEIEERKKSEREKEKVIQKLEKADIQVKTLQSLIPICANCKKVRDDKGFWQEVEKYIEDNSHFQFSHSLCPECSRKLYPQVYDKKPPSE